ncbi:MAG TPA: aldo/keto reductase [Clostridia bacterium]|nr:aldo/keto reductase [Clostridia bacterium]
MKAINIGEQIQIQPIALGATGMGAPENERARFAIMDSFVARGGNCFDTARVYADGESDVTLGKWLRASGMRDRVVICAKGCHPNKENMFASRLSREEILGDLEKSLKAMQLEYTDLYLLHRDDPKKPVSGIVEALHEAVQGGKTRVVGVSNWTVGRIAEANAYAKRQGLTQLSVCQLHYSLALTTAAQTQDITHVPMSNVEFGWYQETGFPVMGFGTQARGFFARCAAGSEQKPGPQQYYGHIPENFRRADRAVRLSKRLGVNLPALLAAYVRDAGLNAVALVGVSSLTQLDEVWEASRFTLTPEQVRYLENGSDA